jgi:DNA polymerase-3 subunit delta'
MLKDLIRETEPVVYEALRRALRSGTVSHAYLFSGEANTPKTEAAYLLAMSLYCQNKDADGMACETCRTCVRVRQNEHLDCRVLDGSEKAISKDDVDALTAGFARASREEGTGQRVCILLHADNSSIAAQNALLKFLEEPGDNVTAILTADGLGRVLPTIVSRCTFMPFVPLAPSYYQKKAEEQGVHPDEAYFLSHLVQKGDGLKEAAAEESFLHAVDMFRQTLDDNGPFAELLADYDISYKIKDKKENLKLLQGWLKLISLYAHDVLLKHEAGPDWYVRLLQKADGDSSYYAEMITIVSEELDRCNKFNDQTLLCAQAYGRLKELKDGKKK